MESETSMGTSHNAANSNQERGHTPIPEGLPEADGSTMACKSEDGKRPHYWMTPSSREPTDQAKPSDCTTKEAGGNAAGTSDMGTSVAAALSLTHAQIGNQG
jgi:hypothetical protein